MRADCLSWLGHPEVKTPALDRLSEDGVLFRNVVTQAPVCVPARISLFTGLYVHQHGCVINPTYNLWPDTPNMVRAVRDAGYETGVRGKLHLFWRHDTELPLSAPLLRKFGFTDAVETAGKCSNAFLRASAYTEHLNLQGLLDRFYRDLVRRVEERTLGVTFGKSVFGEKDQMDGWIMDRGIEFVRRHAGAEKPWLAWSGRYPALEVLREELRQC
ncbi:MAG: sulfatase-like hydrolase/transferase [Kiritimatiellales bacterium]